MQKNIKNLEGVLQLRPGTVLKVQCPTAEEPEFRIIRQARLDPYTKELGVPCDREVSPCGVHAVGPLFQSDFDRGMRVVVATRAEAQWRRFSYGNLSCYKSIRYTVAKGPGGQPLMQIDPPTKPAIFLRQSLLAR